MVLCGKWGALGLPANFSATSKFGLPAKNWYSRQSKGLISHQLHILRMTPFLKALPKKKCISVEFRWWFIPTRRLSKSGQNIPFAYRINALICELPFPTVSPAGGQSKNYWGLMWMAETGLSTSTTPTYLPLPWNIYWIRTGITADWMYRRRSDGLFRINLAG